MHEKDIISLYHNSMAPGPNERLLLHVPYHVIAPLCANMYNIAQYHIMDSYRLDEVSM